EGTVAIGVAAVGSTVGITKLNEGTTLRNNEGVTVGTSEGSIVGLIVGDSLGSIEVSCIGAVETMIKVVGISVVLATDGINCITVGWRDGLIEGIRTTAVGEIKPA